MSVIAKTKAKHLVRPFAGVLAGPAVATPQEPDPRELEWQALKRENERLVTQLDTQRIDALRAIEKAVEEGREAGMAQAARNEEERIALLAAAAAAALAAWGERLTELEALAILLSRTALSKVFDEAADRSDQVVAAIAHQLSLIRREAILAIRVSNEDFVDEAALAGIAAVTGAGLNIVAGPEVATGECRLDLQLGHVEIGPRSQWRALHALLSGMAAEEDAA